MDKSKGRNWVLVFVIAVVGGQLQFPLVKCQEDESSTRCLPRKTFYAFLRLPEVSSNLAAYSRTSRILQDARNDFVQSRILSTDDSDDARICLPATIYYDIFSDPTMRAHLHAIERAQRMMEEPERADGAGIFESEKRSLATLAKNGDLPASIQERTHEEEEDGEKRSEASMTPEDLLKLYVGESLREKPIADMISAYPRRELADSESDSFTEDFLNGKRNIAALAREYALPGRRNIASLAREYGLPNGKRESIFGNRNLAYTLGRFYVIPIGEKRNIGALARDSALPPYGKRSIASLAKNGLFPYPKRNVGTLARDWSLPQTRHGRSLEEAETNGSNPFENQLTDVKNQSRRKRQADYSDEYPLPVMQNTNVLDYEDLIEVLANGFPHTAKRFMGADASMDVGPQDDDTVPLGYHGPYQPSKRHIGALARLGWLPSFRTARFSRSPRYLVAREDSADGATSDNTSNSPTRSLRSERSGAIHYEQSQTADCRHGFRRYLLIPKNDNYPGHKLRYSSGLND